MADEQILGSITDPGISINPPEQNPAPASEASDQILGHINDENAPIETESEHFGSFPEQIKAGLEGIGQGIAGPLATWAERLLGVKGEDILAREKANPVTHAVGEATGFVGSLLTPGLGEASLAGQVGKLGHAAEALVPLAPKLIQTGVRTGAEMAALAASTELSKLVEGDPNQTLGSAAIDVGLSGVMGGVGGAALGVVSPLWQKTKNILGVSKVAADFMAETKYLQGVADPIKAASDEISGRMAESDAMRNVMAEAKPELISNAMPKPTPENFTKVNDQIQDIANKVTSTLKKADQSIKTKSAVPYLYEDFSNWQDAVTKPDATFADQYLATDKFKRTLSEYAGWKGALTDEGSARGALGRELSNYIRPALEDTKVWGGGADIQKVTNKAISEAIDATKDLRGALTSELGGERIVAPEKVQTLLNQANKGAQGRKASVLKNYLEATDKYADAINKVHLDNGLEAPLASSLNPTPILNHTLGTELTPGTQLARWAYEKGSGAVGRGAGNLAASAIGGSLGALVGHPLLGAWVSEKALGPIFSAFAKPFAENALHSTAAKSAIDYLGSAYSGQQVLQKSFGNLFTKGAEVLGKDYIPNSDTREKLKKSLDAFQVPGNQMKVAGDLGHYLPSHSSAAASMAASASQYFDQLKPKQPQLNPLDEKPPENKGAVAKYNRALDIAQQPLMVLKHVKDATLTPQDVATLQTIYPGLHSRMVQLATNGLIDKKHALSYAQRVSLNRLIAGVPLDGTMTPFAGQAIMHTAGMQQAQQAAEDAHQRKSAGVGTGKATLTQMNKVSSMYATPLQARAAAKVK